MAGNKIEDGFRLKILDLGTRKNTMAVHKNISKYAEVIYVIDYRFS